MPWSLGNSKDVESYDRLVGCIYAAATGEVSWDRALDEIARATNACNCSLVGQDEALGEGWVFAPHADPESAKDYSEYYWRHDPLMHTMTRMPLGQVLRTDQVMSLDDFEKSVLYNEWWRKQHLGTMMLGANVVVEPGSSAAINILHSHSKERFEAGEERLFAYLVPHMIRAVGIWRAQSLARHRPDLFSNREPGFVLVDAKGRILNGGERCRHLLGELGLLASFNGRDQISDKREDLLGAIREAGQEQSIESDRCDFAFPADGGTLLIRVMPVAALQGHDTLPVDKPAAKLCLSLRPAAGPEAATALQRLYGLTGAEAKVAAEIARGTGRKAAAARLGISEATVRTHLSKIFAKTGVTRQAGIARLIAQLEG